MCPHTGPPKKLAILDKMRLSYILLLKIQISFILIKTKFKICAYYSRHEVGENVNNKPVSYLQTDPRWGSLDYSAPGERTTIAASGCGPTAMAMVLATWADKSVNPKTECAWALAHGYKAPHSGTYYGYFEPAGKRFGLKVYRLNYSNLYGNSKSAYHAQARDALDRGDLVIACMGKGNWTRSGHYVLVYGVESGTIYINDPASTKTSRTRGSYGLFKQQVKYYWVIEKPVSDSGPKKEEHDMTEKDVIEIINKSKNVYETVEAVPDWGQPTVKKLVDKGLLNGEGDGLGLTYDLLRVLVINDRAGLYD